MASGLARRLLARFPRGIDPSILLVAVTTGVVFALGEGLRMSSIDGGLYLALGRDMSGRGGLADVERLAFPIEGARWVNGAWGAERILHACVALAGYGALQAALAACAAATVLVTGLAARRLTRHEGVRLLAAPLCALLLIGSIGLRPQMLVHPLFALYAALALAFRPTWRTGIASCAVVAIWANLHRSFPIAPALSLLVAGGVAWEEGFGAEARGHLAIAAAAGAASLANPWGPRLLLDVWANQHVSSGRGGWEWQATTLTDAAGARLALATLIAIAVLALGRRLPRRRDLPALLAFLLLALDSRRHVVWLGAILPLALARAWPEPEERPTRLPAAVSLPLLAAVAVLIALRAPLRGPHGGGAAEIRARFDDSTPEALVAPDATVDARVYAPMEWAGWIAWRCPGERVLFDSRDWLFDDSVFADYVSIRDASVDWSDRLARRGIDRLYLDRVEDALLLPRVEASPDWEKVRESPQGAVFRRR